MLVFPSCLITGILNEIHSLVFPLDHTSVLPKAAVIVCSWVLLLNCISASVDAPWWLRAFMIFIWVLISVGEARKKKKKWTRDIRAVCLLSVKFPYSGQSAHCNSRCSLLVCMTRILCEKAHLHHQQSALLIIKSMFHKDNIYCTTHTQSAGWSSSLPFESRIKLLGGTFHVASFYFSKTNFVQRKKKRRQGFFITDRGKEVLSFLHNNECPCISQYK